MIDIHWYVIIGAFALDFMFGDPRRWPHPVTAMGNAISFFEPVFRKIDKNQVVSGWIFAIFLIGSTWLLSLFLVLFCMAIHPLLGVTVQAILLFFCFSSRTLEKEAMNVFYALKNQGLQAAREQVAMIVGRQTDKLDEKGVTRACIETVAENFVDGFLSPLFFALIGGVPAALAYKMVNTLDSMVGYKNDQYIDFGRASALIDDIANFIPSKLSVIFICFAACFFSLKKGEQALTFGFFEGKLHKSPNAGYPEAAFAGALEIRLGGPSMYHGKRVEKPFIGSRFKDPARHKIKQACDLMMTSSILAALCSCIILVLF